MEDARTAAWGEFLAGRAGLLADDLRDALGVSYLAGLNAQAMLFEPAAARLELATGAELAPAALQRWQALELGPVLRGGGLQALAL